MSSDGPRDLLDAFKQTAEALQQFGLERVRVEGLSSSASVGIEDGIRTVTEQQFMRDFVFHLRPCIIVDAIDEWPAMTKWRNDRYLFNLDQHLPLVESEADTNEEEEEEEASNIFLRRAAGVHERRVTVALTPNGRADAVTHVVYERSDVPAELQSLTFGEAAAPHAVPLEAHPALGAAEHPGPPHPGPGVVAEKVFLSAAEVRVTLPEFYRLLQGNAYTSSLPPTHIDMRELRREGWRGAIVYGQLQNNCFNTEFTHLHQDVLPNIDAFGRRVFGSAPEASNVWFGTGVSVSSLHQDWVENLYAVVRGVKEFLLIPPWEGIFVPKPEIPSAAFALDADRTNREKLDFKFRPFPVKDGEVMPWMDFDVSPEFVESASKDDVLGALNAAIDACHEEAGRRLPSSLRGRLPPRRATALHPIVAHVHPGETLYLPAMWLHRVSQRADGKDVAARAKSRAATSGGAVEPPLPLIAAVNYWYDMSFDNPAVVMLREFGLLL
eukprot:gene316-178_t